ncbi:MAG: YdcF family protein [Anaerolineales bacterium]|nr:YdcF family protein [Anaerolineales bacterium]
MWRLALRISLTLLLLYPLSLALLDGYGLADRAQPADAIVVLGSRVYPGGEPGPSLMRRAEHAAALYAQGLAPLIVCTGGQGDPSVPSEAAVACGLIAAQGVPAATLLLEDQSHSTEENALYTAALLTPRGARRVIVVSDSFHLYRAQLLFRRAGLVPYPSPAGPRLLWVERYFRGTRELAALGWYWGKTALGLPMTDFPERISSARRPLLQWPAETPP